MIRLAVFLFSTAVLTAPAWLSAWAHEGHDHETCPPGEVCGQAAAIGAWGMIALGTLFWVVALLPSKSAEDAEKAPRTRIPFLTMLEVRLDKETSGWRRLQWPVMGLAFIALGVATLLGSG